MFFQVSFNISLWWLQFIRLQFYKKSVARLDSMEKHLYASCRNDCLVFMCCSSLWFQIWSNNKENHCSSSGYLWSSNIYITRPFFLCIFPSSYLVSSVAMKKPSSEASSQFCLCLLIPGMVLGFTTLIPACKVLPLVMCKWGAACWNGKENGNMFSIELVCECSATAVRDSGYLVILKQRTIFLSELNGWKSAHTFSTKNSF